MARCRDMRQSGHTRFWTPWTRMRCACLQPAWTRGLHVLTALKLWEKSLNTIRGKSGSSIRSYFSFLRFLLLLNLTSLLLTAGLVILPTLRTGGTYLARSSLAAPCGNSSSPPARSSLSALLDLFTGQGFLQDSFLFYGHYSGGSGTDSAYNTRLAYLLTPLTFLIVCSLGLLQCTVTGVTQRRVRSRTYRTPISSRVFSSWDFCIQGADTSSLKQQSLSHYFKSYLAEELRFWENAQLSVSERALLLLLRILINGVILALMVGGFYCIHLAADLSQDYQGSGGVVTGLVMEYLVPIVISLVLLILPHCFMQLVRFEGHSPGTEVTLTLIRCVFLRLGTLGIFFFSLGQKLLCLGSGSAHCVACGYNAQFQCWETSLGQELYKLSVFHFLKMLMEFFFLQLPRRFLVSRWRAARWLGRERFQLSQHVLDTVYGQTLVMAGLFYAPLLPLLNLAFIFITFYMKKFTLQRLCDGSQKLFRESTLRMLFHFVLLLGLISVLLPLLYLITSVRPSRACGPFTEYRSSWQVTHNSSVLPPAVRTVWRYVTSEGSAYGVFFILCLLFTALVSGLRQTERDVERLKDLLSCQTQDKDYLVRRLREEQERQRLEIGH